MQVAIRPECVEDRDAIHDLTQRAFAPMPFAAGDEQELIDVLRKNGALSLSLVATHKDTVVGHVAFSPAQANDGAGNWYALGPVAVEPAMQAQGIGSLLIEEGVRQLVSRKAAGCILVGDPDYYARFGFRSFPDLTPAGEPPAFFMILPLTDPSPSSPMRFHPLFHAGNASA